MPGIVAVPIIACIEDTEIIEQIPIHLDAKAAEQLAGGDGCVVYLPCLLFNCAGELEDVDGRCTAAGAVVMAAVQRVYVKGKSAVNSFFASLCL